MFYVERAHIISLTHTFALVQTSPPVVCLCVCVSGCSYVLSAELLKVIEIEWVGKDYLRTAD